MTTTDQLDRELEFATKPMRVISLVPSITELVLDLGIGERLIGRTKFCIHPAQEVSGVKIIGGTKNIRLEEIKALKPDLIIANKEENVESQVLELAAEFPIYISDVKNEASALEMISDLGELLDLDTQDLISTITKASFNMLSLRKNLGSAIYIIWNAPIMAAGSDTFIHEMMSVAGFSNVITDSRYPELSKDKILELNPSHILLSSEPFPFKKKHMAQFQSDFPNAKIQLVDGEMFSWYGSKMAEAYKYFLKMFYK